MAITNKPWIWWITVVITETKILPSKIFFNDYLLDKFGESIVQVFLPYSKYFWDV